MIITIGHPFYKFVASISFIVGVGAAASRAVEIRGRQSTGVDKGVKWSQGALTS
jgi:hypothetical protein